MPCPPHHLNHIFEKFRAPQYLHGMVDVIRGSECTNTVDIVQYWDQEHGEGHNHKQTRQFRNPVNPLLMVFFK